MRIEIEAGTATTAARDGEAHDTRYSRQGMNVDIHGTGARLHFLDEADAEHMARDILYRLGYDFKGSVAVPPKPAPVPPQPCQKCGVVGGCSLDYEIGEIRYGRWCCPNCMTKLEKEVERLRTIAPPKVTEPYYKTCTDNNGRICFIHDPLWVNDELAKDMAYALSKARAERLATK